MNFSYTTLVGRLHHQTSAVLPELDVRFSDQAGAILVYASLSGSFFFVQADLFLVDHAAFLVEVRVFSVLAWLRSFMHSPLFSPSWKSPPAGWFRHIAGVPPDD